MKVDVLLCLQWGDEGKGNIIDVLTPEYDIIARFQGGPNAGHTLEFNKQRQILHTIPSGIFHKEKMNLIGNGVIIDPFILNNEFISLYEKNVDPRENLLISKKAHIILPSHRLLDAAYEKAKGKSKIGSTLKGIGPAYTDKISRNGIRVGDILENGFLNKYKILKQKHLDIIEFLKFNYSDYLIDKLNFDEYEQKWLDGINMMKGLKIIDSEYFINESLYNNKKILAEGAQGTLLDIDFGSYPFVTSSNTVSSGVCSGLGIAPKKINNIFGVFKAYCTRVGSGPFPTELTDKTGEALRVEGKEFGSTTGRPRRCGWLDIPALKYAIMLNGIDELFMMKADVMSLFAEIKVCTHYEYGDQLSDHIPYDMSQDLIKPHYKSLPGWNKKIDNIKSLENIPADLSAYINYIENEVKLPINIVSVGPDREQTIKMNRL
ncbi:MAG: adenylosuccinate synthase [Bacteroidales bacterium]|nr:adenylosuccinate synthase [Bacteroidales bacterium]